MGIHPKDLLGKLPDSFPNLRRGKLNCILAIYKLPENCILVIYKIPQNWISVVFGIASLAIQLTVITAKEEKKGIYRDLFFLP
jgi:hypothetical protein